MERSLHPVMLLCACSASDASCSFLFLSLSCSRASSSSLTHLWAGDEGADLSLHTSLSTKSFACSEQLSGVDPVQGHEPCSAGASYCILLVLQVLFRQCCSGDASRLGLLLIGCCLNRLLFRRTCLLLAFFRQQALQPHAAWGGW